MLPILLLAALSAAPAAAREGRTVAVDPLGRGTWVVDEEHEAVSRLTDGEAPKRFTVGRWPQRLVVDSAGRVFATCGANGRLVRIAGDETAAVDLGGEPRALLLD